ncbi:hypothetical protein [Abyssisolibacter fermentans]|uniref:hypothetical protein n=1 Tax=Abyssisolibacter fermentans TaxID=1766203 RepID=UPI0008304189|nr:hypothetical protein [Abyssisolibacter fermentans]
MLLIFMGESCTGKSTIASKLKELKKLEIFSGKDYLRFAKNEASAWEVFSEKLMKASLETDVTKSIIYVVTEKDELSKLDGINSINVKFTADIDVIKSRFSKRMKGNLPKPVEKMIERKSLEWKDVKGDLYIDTSNENNIEENVNKILNLLEEKR